MRQNRFWPLLEQDTHRSQRFPARAGCISPSGVVAGEVNIVTGGRRHSCRSRRPAPKLILCDRPFAVFHKQLEHGMWLPCETRLGFERHSTSSYDYCPQQLASTLPACPRISCWETAPCLTVRATNPVPRALVALSECLLLAWASSGRRRSDGSCGALTSQRLDPSSCTAG
jgi:hypothetical protein